MSPCNTPFGRITRLHPIHNPASWPSFLPHRASDRLISPDIKSPRMWLLTMDGKRIGIAPPARIRNTGNVDVPDYRLLGSDLSVHSVTPLVQDEAFFPGHVQSHRSTIRIYNHNASIDHTLFLVNLLDVYLNHNVRGGELSDSRKLCPPMCRWQLHHFPFGNPHGERRGATRPPPFRLSTLLQEGRYASLQPSRIA